MNYCSIWIPYNQLLLNSVNIESSHIELFCCNLQIPPGQPHTRGTGYYLQKLYSYFKNTFWPPMDRWEPRVPLYTLARGTSIIRYPTVHVYMCMLDMYGRTSGCAISIKWAQPEHMSAICRHHLDLSTLTAHLQMECFQVGVNVGVTLRTQHLGIYTTITTLPTARILGSYRRRNSCLSLGGRAGPVLRLCDPKRLQILGASTALFHETGALLPVLLFERKFQLLPDRSENYLFFL